MAAAGTRPSRPASDGPKGWTLYLGAVLAVSEQTAGRSYSDSAGGPEIRGTVGVQGGVTGGGRTRAEGASAEGGTQDSEGGSSGRGVLPGSLDRRRGSRK